MNRRAFLERTLAGVAGAAATPTHLWSTQPARVTIDRAEVIEFAKSLCRIPSFTTEETEVAQFLDEYFRSEGFESELQQVDPGRFQCIGRLKGTGGGESLMLNGHIDIDPLPAGLERDPFEPAVEGDLFFGAGILNMKAGVTAMMQAAVAAKRANLGLRGDVVVACVVGELQGGAGTVHMLESGITTDYAIVAEPHGADNVLTKHAGVLQLAIHVLGRMSHISRKDDGVNAILKASTVVRALDELEFTGPRDPELPELPLINVGSILGGRGRDVELRGPNIVPDFCTIYADVRFTQGMTPETVVGDIRRTLEGLQRSDPELRFEIEFPMKPERRMLREVMMPFSVASDSAFIQTLVKHVRRVRGREPHVGVQLPSGYSGNDTSHLFAAGIPCVLHGPAGGVEGPERYLWASIDEMTSCANVYGAMIEEICA